MVVWSPLLPLVVLLRRQRRKHGGAPLLMLLLSDVVGSLAVLVAVERRIRR